MKIKIEREEVPMVRVAGSLFKVGTLYYCKSGPNQHHAYILKRIFKNSDNEWMFKLGEQVFDETSAVAHLDYDDPQYFRRCECGFSCEGYVQKGWAW